MTRCVEFYDKFEKDGNFCHLSPGAISQIKAYNEMRGKIGTHIPDKQLVVDNFPEFAARAISTHAKDEETKTKALDYVVKCLKRGEKVTAGDLKSTIQGWLKGDGGKCSVEQPRKKVYERKGSGAVSDGKQEEKPDPSPVTLKDRLPEEPAPTVQTCKDQEKLTGAPVQSPFKTASQVKNGIAGEMFPGGNSSEIPKSSPAWTPAACPACPHVVIQKVLGNKCKQTGGLCQDVKECPVERRKQMAQEQGFVIAGSGTPLPQGKPLTNEHPPLKVIPVQLTKEQAEAAITSVVRGYFTPKSREQWDSLKRVGRWDTDLEALEGLRDDAAERLP